MDILKDFKLNEIPQRIKELEKDGDFELAQRLKQEYEYAKQAFDGLTFNELLLIFYIGCCRRDRAFCYARIIKEEALCYQKYLEFLDEREKILNKFKLGADNV